MEHLLFDACEFDVVGGSPNLSSGRWRIFSDHTFSWRSISSQISQKVSWRHGSKCGKNQLNQPDREVESWTTYTLLDMADGIGNEINASRHLQNTTHLSTENPSWKHLKEDHHHSKVFFFFSSAGLSLGPSTSNRCGWFSGMISDDPLDAWEKVHC